VIRRLRINDATEAEINFLMGEGNIGQRVELNATDRFVAFVERKLRENGAVKAIPNARTLDETYGAFVRGERSLARLNEELRRLRSEAVEVPSDLAEHVRERLVGHPDATWDDVIRALAKPKDDRAEG